MAARPAREPRLLTEERLVVCGLVAATQMSWGSVVPVLPHYVEQLGAGEVALGAIIAAFGVGRLVANIPAGLLVRRLPTWPLLLVCVAVVLAGTLAMGALGSLPWVLAIRFVTGAFAGAAITVGQLIVLGGSRAETRGRVTSMIQSIQLAGAALGPALGGIVMSAWGVLPAFVAASSGCVVFLVWAIARDRPLRAMIADRERDAVRAYETEAALPRPRAGAAGMRRAAVVLGIVAANLTGFAIFSARFGGQQSLVPVMSVTAAGVEPWLLGTGIGVSTILSLAVLPGFGVLADRGGRRWLVSGALAAAALLTMLFAVVDEPVPFVLVLIVTGVLAAIVSGLPLADIADLVPPRRLPLATGIFRTSGDVGTIVAPLALALVLERFGPTAAVTALAAVLAFGAVCALLAPRRGPVR